MDKLIKSLVVLAGIAIVVLTGFYALCLNHVGINQVGVAYNSANGAVAVQTNAGWYVTSPMTKVVTLPTLPEQVHLPTSANIIATKIVKIRADKVIDFVKLQGFGYDLHINYNNILMGYAFSGKNYSFLEIVQDSTQADNK